MFQLDTISCRIAAELVPWQFGIKVLLRHKAAKQKAPRFTIGGGSTLPSLAPVCAADISRVRAPSYPLFPPGPTVSQKKTLPAFHAGFGSR
ncbi:hypothetical protein KCU61_g386, partial [Aureobasidium melanogenum]